ncbi:MAG: D-isomer specific 2-hydroxyacid dehydrogenase family protein [Actinomycetota bacterium]|nr:D-isomer specific 2-hydroxyacid dehydrogenase family protein [Actinomycetota bacterium]
MAIVPADRRAGLAEAIESAGGTVVDLGSADGLVWTATGFEPGFQAAELVDTLRRHPNIGWIQLPWAGVEPYAAAGVFDHDHRWTSAKGVYSKPVAEHALALTLAGFRDLKRFGLARGWTAQSARTLFGASVTIFGGGGITDELIRLLAPFDCRVTVVRKRPRAMAGVAGVVGWDHRDQALAGADAVVLALALTPETEGFLGRPQFETMADHAWVVNIARGRHIVTSDLVEALSTQVIGGACLDVTDPEPLPDDHPLWALPNCLITPHTANTQAMAAPLLASRVADNVARLAAGRPLAGQVDPDLGY